MPRLSVEEFAHSLVREAEYYASPEYPSDRRWQDEPATTAQLRLIRMRRCGPNFLLRLPEPLYKAILRQAAGVDTVRGIITKGQAVRVLDAFAYTDADVLAQYRALIEDLQPLWGQYAAAG